MGGRWLRWRIGGQAFEAYGELGGDYHLFHTRTRPSGESLSHSLVSLPTDRRDAFLPAIERHLALLRASGSCYGYAAITRGRAVHGIRLGESALEPGAPPLERQTTCGRPVERDGGWTRVSSPGGAPWAAPITCRSCLALAPRF